MLTLYLKELLVLLADLVMITTIIELYKNNGYLNNNKKKKGRDDTIIMTRINFDINSAKFSLTGNQEQLEAIQRIKAENTIPVTGPPGTGKSTVISRCCFDLIEQYYPVLVVAPTNAMVDSILVKIDSLLQPVKLELPKGFIIRYGNTTELRY